MEMCLIMFKIEFKNKFFQFIYITKISAYYILILWIILESLYYYFKFLFLGDRSYYLEKNSLDFIGFTSLPISIILYLNFIKSRCLFEYILGVFLLYFIFDIYKFIKKIYFFNVENNKYYSEASSTIFFIVMVFFFSLALKLLLLRIKNYKLLEFKDNFMKYQKKIFLIFFIIPSVVIIFLTLIIEVFNDFNSKNIAIDKFLILFQIPNIIQLYLNIHKSNNLYEKHIGFLIFSINLIISFVYIVFSSNKELPPPSIYLSIYCVFSPIILALGLKYILTILPGINKK